MNHECPANPSILDPLPSHPKAIVIGAFKEKAFVDLRDEGKLFIDENYVRSLDGDSRQALLWHEAAHLQAGSCARYCEGKPNGCERCADNRLGACMYIGGFDRDRAKRALVGLNLSREGVVLDGMAGFDYAAKKTTPAVPQTGINLTSPRLVAPGDPGSDQDGFENAPTEKLPTDGPPAPGKPAEIIDATDISQAGAHLSDAIADTATCRCCRYDCLWIVGVCGAVVSLMTAVVVATVKP
jgi:hypothetical protein